jgi:hypothetical protein
LRNLKNPLLKGVSRGTTRFSKDISERANRELFDEKWFSELTLSLKTKLQRLIKLSVMIDEAGGAPELESSY